MSYGSVKDETANGRRPEIVIAVAVDGFLDGQPAITAPKHGDHFCSYE
jgi:hypothetical protein